MSSEARWRGGRRQPASPPCVAWSPCLRNGILRQGTWRDADLPMAGCSRNWRGRDRFRRFRVRQARHPLVLGAMLAGQRPSGGSRPDLDRSASPSRMLGLGALQPASAAEKAHNPRASVRSCFVTAARLSSGLAERKRLARCMYCPSASIGRSARIDTVTLWSTAKLIAAKVANRIAMTDGQRCPGCPARPADRWMHPGSFAPSSDAFRLLYLYDGCGRPIPKGMIRNGSHSAANGSRRPRPPEPERLSRAGALP